MQHEDAAVNAPPAADADDAPAYQVSPDMVDEIIEALAADDFDFVRVVLDELHAADQADLLEQLPAKKRRKLLSALSDDLEPEALTELDEAIRDEVIDQLAPQDLAAAVSELEADDAAYLLEDLDEAERKEVLDAVPLAERVEVETALSYPEDSAGRLMQRDLIAVPPYWTVGQTIDYLRETDDLPDDFYEIFVVDANLKPAGTVRLDRIMRSRRDVRIEDIMQPDPIVVNAATDQEEVAYLFQQYDLVSALVVNDHNRLLGAIMVDDVVDVIQEEAEEDIMLLGGVSDGGVHDSTLRTTRDRFIWLFANLLTAILASSVISLFGATLEQMVALAILMPIVASMGGNAGTQTLTVAVRALGMKELTTSNALRIVGREVLVGGINGVMFAIIMGGLTAAWFGDWLLGGVIALAMIINMLVAALAGILVPLGLNRVGIDPAIASSVFVTTVTDVVGFFAFLGLAALILF